MRRGILVLLVVVPSSLAAGQAPPYVWLEAEKFDWCNFRHFEVSSMGKPQLLSAGRWIMKGMGPEEVKRLVPEEGVLLRYRLKAPKTGRYTFWARIGWFRARADFQWRLGNGPWHDVPKTYPTRNLMELGFFCEVSWANLGQVQLQARETTLEVRFPKARGPKDRMLCALDCFAFIQGPFTPEGPLKPGETYSGEKDRAAARQVFRLPPPGGAARTEVKLDGLWQVARYDDPDTDDRLVGGASSAFLVEHEFGGGQLAPVREDRPLPVVVGEDRIDRDGVHVRLVVGVEGSHVAPVSVLALGLARHDVLVEVVHLGDAPRDERRDDVPTEIVFRILVRGILGDDLPKHVGVEHVVPHRHVGPGRVTRDRFGMLRLLDERDDRAVLVGSDHTEVRRLFDRCADTGDRDTRSGFDVRADHLPRVHAVDVVGAEHDHVVGVFVGEDVEVLEDGVGRTGEPVRTAPHLGGNGRDVVAEHLAHRPSEGKVPVEAVTLVLGKDRDPPVPAVDEVRENEVDESVDAAERNGGFRAVAGERVEPLPFPSGENESDDFRFHVAKPSRRRPGPDRSCSGRCR